MRTTIFKTGYLCLVVLFMLALAGTAFCQSDPVEVEFGGAVPTESAHKAQMEELEAQPKVISEDTLEAQDLETRGVLFPKRKVTRGTTSAETQIDNDFIVFGYIQDEDIVYHIRWNALTHIGSLFVSFDAAGNLTGTSAFTGRSSYLRAGGAADAAGVKVILVINNFDDAGGGDIETVMTTPALRSNLVDNIVALVGADTYCHGVSIDLEFSWGSSVRDGITAFMSELRSDLDVVDPNYELSIYTNAFFSSSQWDFDASTGITPHINYMLYSMYTWAGSSSVHCVSDFNSCLGSSLIPAYLNDGLPPEKLVLTISTYGKKYDNATTYNGSGTRAESIGFTDGLHDTTLNTQYSGPYTNNYVTGDESGWYTWNTGAMDRAAVWDNTASLEYKIRHALSLQDPAGDWNGRKIRGVGFWSLKWLAEESSWDPRASTSVSRSRTYPHIYQLCEEILSSPGTRRFVIEGYEGLDYRWRDPNESPDTVGDSDSNTSRGIVASPAGTGAPGSTTNAMQVSFDLEGAGINAVYFGHEVLNSPNATSVTDVHAVAGVVDSTTTLYAYMYTASNYSGYQVRMMILDADNEIEVSDAFTLNTSGWREISMDLTDSGQINAYTTSEPNHSSGDGVLDTAGGGARDIGFIGFLIQGNGAMNGTVVFDEVTYEHTNPGGNEYVINEFRYSDVNNEFVEIYGPSGAFPAGFQVRFISGADGSATTVTPAGSVPNDGGGFGYFVVGDPSVPNVDYSTGFSNVADNISDNNPSGVQLYSSSTGCVYDSVVYEAWGGLDDLVREETLGVTTNGYPWLGDIAAGTDGSGIPYSMGRFPDGTNTYINYDDFSFMGGTPGASNGGSVSVPTTYNFSSTPSGPFQTYQSFSVADPVSSGIPASPSGGNAHRCVDTAGGGVISVIGDAALGAGGAGYSVSGEIYIPSAGASAQAIAIGICGKMGSTFFTSSTYSPNSSYESGYWLIYENTAGVGMNEGIADHANYYYFVHATHDNMDGDITTTLGTRNGATVGPQGSWATFFLEVAPNGPAGETLVAQVNGVDVYRGVIPTDGPTSGAFQVGFRENHTGAPGLDEGTWIDNVTIGAATSIDRWMEY